MSDGRKMEGVSKQADELLKIARAFGGKDYFLAVFRECSRRGHNERAWNYQRVANAMDRVNAMQGAFQ